MEGFVCSAPSFEVVRKPNEPVIMARISMVAPTKRDPAVKGLSEYGFAEQRMIDILRALREKTALPPIEVNQQSLSPHCYNLYHGFHRYYASIAAGFSHLPITVVPDVKAFLDAEQCGQVKTKL
jgi:hypothetical protein